MSSLKNTLNDEDAIDLPPIPRTSRDHAPAEESSLPLNKRRQLYDCESNSSDPPMFSSDGPQTTIGAENYSHDLKRRKTKYLGTWWGEKHAGPGPEDGRRKFTRNLDSGVWMGSEGTDDSFEEDFLMHHDTQSRSALAVGSHPAYAMLHLLNEDASHSSGTGRPPMFRFTGKRVASETVNENVATSPRQEARVIVQRCLEESKEIIDLSNLNLRSLPGDIVQPLRTLTKQPAIETPPASQEQFQPLVPKLSIFLANNALPALPKELFALQNIRVLSIRSNELETLPSCIIRLQMLEELNIAYNRLRWLPWEIVALHDTGSLNRVILHPNPFEKPDPSTCEELSRMKITSGFQCLGKGEVTLLDKRGNPWKRPNSMLPFSDAISKEAQVSGPRSLLEIATQECARSPFSGELRSLLPGDGPESVARLVDLATDVQAEGGRTCSVCRRSYIIPRTEWVEWWQLNWCCDSFQLPAAHEDDMPRTLPKDNYVPILRRGCSWACRPEDTEGQRELWPDRTVW